MSISVELSEEQSRRLEQPAAQLGIDPQNLVQDLIAQPPDDFQRAVAEMLRND